MATLVLQAAGAAVGGLVGGPFGAVLGRAAGALGGRYIDQQLFGGNADRSVHGPRLESTRVLSSREGAPIARIFGRGRVSGEVIWATAFEEETSTTSQSRGGKGIGGGPKTTTTTYSYYANFAVGLCEGEIGRVGRIWADGEEIVQPEHTIRIYTGTETQLPDPLIEAKQGAGRAPAYRGLAYVVFEHFLLERYGNRIPQIAVEIVRPVSPVSRRVRAVNMIPGATEFGYDPHPVSEKVAETKIEHLNVTQTTHDTDFAASLNGLATTCPNLEQVALVVAWFGDDLRAGSCKVEPRVQVDNRILAQGDPWNVAGLTRRTAGLVSKVDGRPSYGGTPSDGSVVRAIQAIRAKGLRVALNPFVMMDVPAGNGLPSPYGGIGQPTHPWRGRITCDPAPGAPATVDRTAAATEQIATFASGRADGWDYRRMVLHYADLAVRSGGVDLFILGSELRGLTSVRGPGDTFPFVDALRSLAAEVRAILGPDTRITYGADWSEYFGYQPADGSGDVFYNLDPLWADANIDAVGIDNYVPISDWRERGSPDGLGTFSTDPDMLEANVGRGEGYDWYYATAQDRAAGIRTDITDGAGKPWVYRYKDFASWWSNHHFDRRGGVDVPQASPWVPRSKPIVFTEFGFPAVHNGAAEPNAFVDAKSSETRIPYFSRAARDDLAMMNAIDATQTHWDDRHPSFDPARNPRSAAYDGRMVDMGSSQLWAWDARPFPAFPDRADLWADAGNWRTGHWLNGRLDGLPIKDFIATVLDEAGMTRHDVRGVQGMIDGYILGEPASPRSVLESVLSFYRIAVHEDRGTLVFRSPAWGAVEAYRKDELTFEKDAVEATVERMHGAELPDRVRVLHVDPQTVYEDAETSARVLGRRAQGDIVLSQPFVANTEILAPIAKDYIEGIRLGREAISFTLPPSDLAISVGDAVRLPEFSQDRIWRVDDIEDGATRKLTASAHIEGEPVGRNPEASNAATPRISVPAVLSPVSKPIVEMLDLPFLRPDQAQANRIAISAAPWPGEMAVFVSPTSADHVLSQIVLESAVLGSLLTPLGPSNIVSRFANGDSIDVRVIGGTLQSVDQLSLLAGANAFAIRSGTGRYEIIQAQTVELVEERTYRLKHLLRGLAGTEPEAEAGAGTGARLVALDARVPELAGAQSRSGAPHEWLVGPSRDPLDAFNYRRVDYAPGGRGFQTYSPVHLRAEWSGTGGLSCRWIRRDRLSDDDWNDLEIPMSEDTEVYEVRVSSGIETLVLTSTAPSITVPAAELADAFGTATSITIDVAQMSRRTGAGPRATLTVDQT